MKLDDTTLPKMYSKGLFDEKSFDVAPEHTHKIFDVLFTGTANLLNCTKSLTTPTAFVFKDTTGALICGAVVQYFPPEDKKNPGNWSLVWTFNESDIPTPPNGVVIDMNSTSASSYFISVAGQKWGMMFEGSSQMNTLFTYLLQQLRKWLDENAKEGSTVTIEQPGVFQARVAIENGEKVFALEADGEIKNLIKDDAAIEK